MSGTIENECRALSSCEEDWRPVVGYEDAYAVSSLGRVMRIAGSPRGGARPGRVLRPVKKDCAPSPGAYAVLGLSRNNRVRQHYVHHLVATAFLGPRPSGAQVNHCDGDKLHNAAANLEYVSPLGNARHAIAGGRWQHQGSHNGAARLTEGDVRVIRDCARWMAKTRIMEKFQIARGTLNGILARRSWRHA